MKDTDTRADPWQTSGSVSRESWSPYSDDKRGAVTPFLLAITLAFWGWQSQLLVAGLVMGAILESPRWIQTRWDFTDRDFNRIWTFCTLLLLAVIVYAFTANEGPSHFGGFFQHPDLRTERGIGVSTAKTMAQVIRWLPMVFFLFIAAQQFSTRGAIPLETISLILRWQWRRAKKLGHAPPARRNIDVSYVYFTLCMVAASVHASENTTYFWGLCVLTGWALWPRRARSVYVWAGVLAVVIGLGYFGQGGLGRMRIYLEGFNPQWLSNWTRRNAEPDRSRTAIGQVGRVKGSSAIVIRLEPMNNSHPPALLREASYRDYLVRERAEWRSGSSRDSIQQVYHEKQDENTYVFVPYKTNVVGVKIASYLDRPKGLLPLPEGVARVENLPVYGLSMNTAGAVLAEGPGLVTFDAYYGPGQTLDSPADEKEDRLVRDQRDIAALKKLIKEYQLEGNTREQTLKRINAFFENNFSYSRWQDKPIMMNTNETALTRFLLRTRKGHCEYFATATVLMLRQMGIPARYAVGFSVHEASGKKYIVRERDAHAWCLVWNREQKIWENFDTTPASWLASEQEQASRLQFLSDMWYNFVFQLSKLRWGQTHLREYILWGLAPVLAFLFYQIISRGQRKRKGGNADEHSPIWPGLDSEFYEIERRMERRGFLRQKNETLGKWLHRASESDALMNLEPPLKKAISLHYRYRFDPKGLSGEERETLRREARECLALLDGQKA